MDEQQLPEEVRTLTRWAADGYPLGDIGAAQRECLAWLKKEILP